MYIMYLVTFVDGLAVQPNLDRPVYAWRFPLAATR